jgi:hypothetical protein
MPPPGITAWHDWRNACIRNSSRRPTSAGTVQARLKAATRRRRKIRCRSLSLHSPALRRRAGAFATACDGLELDVPTRFLLLYVRRGEPPAEKKAGFLFPIN